MTQILLRSNWRFGALGAGLCAACACLSLWFALVADGGMARWTAFGVCLTTTILALLAWEFFFLRPRIAINEHELLVYVGKVRAPFRVPLGSVEVFFIGQGAVLGDEPGQPKDYHGPVAANVIVRLAESATDWHRRDVNRWLAVWNDGYITVRGLWCEDINQDVLKEMNHRLVTAKRKLR